MAYSYQAERYSLFTEAGQIVFLQMRDRAKLLLKEAGAFRLQELLHGQTGDTWQMIACADRMVELGEISEITGSDLPAEHRVFVKGRAKLAGKGE